MIKEELLLLLSLLFATSKEERQLPLKPEKNEKVNSIEEGLEASLGCHLAASKISKL